MDDLRIERVDWSSPDHRQAVLELIDLYACEPIEGGRPLPDTVRRRMIDGLREHPTSLGFLAYRGLSAVGVAICFRGFSTFAAKPLINIHDLAVRSEHRGRGVGTRLLETILTHARETGCCKVTLEVRAANGEAARLYRRLGFGDPGGKATQFLDHPLA